MQGQSSPCLQHRPSLPDLARRVHAARWQHRGAFQARRQERRPSRVAAAASSGSSNGSGKPQRGVVILPGLGNSAADYAAIAADLQSRGLAVSTALVSRPDWLRNAAGLARADYWRGTLQPLPTVSWYMDRIAAALESVATETSGGPVTLLAHSAGGWLSRVFLLEMGVGPVDRLVTLGSPHNPPPKGVIDQTRGILTHVAATCPGNFHEQVAYVTIAGKWIRGATLRDPDATWAQKAVGAGYAQVSGRPDVWGDGITPLDAAHLEGAKQVTLEGVYHSPLGASEPSPDGKQKGRPWYGSPGVIDRWVTEVVRDPAELAGFRKELGDVAEGSMLPDNEKVSELSG